MPKAPFKRTPKFVQRARLRAAFSEGQAAGSTGWPGSLVAPSIAGIAVTPQTALGYTAYLAGVRVISEDVASLPIATYRRKKSGGSMLATDNAITERFSRSPSGAGGTIPSMQWREAWIAHVLGWGNGYAEIDWSEGGDLLGMELLHPNNTQARYDESGELYYELNRPATILRDGRLSKLPPWRILHLAGLGFNGLVGYSPVALAREAIGLGKAAEQFGASLFGNGAIPKGYLKHPGKLKPDALANLRSSINERHQGSGNANKLAILEEGMDWVSTQINPDDAQFLLTRQFQVVEICRILRLPPHKLADLTNAHFTNIEASNLDYLMTCLRPWCIRIEQCLDLKLLTDKEARQGYYVRHDIRAILRASIKDRAEYYQKMFQFGMSPDEIREMEDMNPIGEEGGGGKRFRPANLTPLDAEEPETPPDSTDPNVTPEEKAGMSLDPGNRVFGPKNGHFSHENGVI